MIEVSNFQQQDLEIIFSAATAVPHVNQLRVHAGNTQTDLLPYCASKDILVQAHSPIAQGEIMKNAEVQAMAGKYPCP